MSTEAGHVLLLAKSEWSNTRQFCDFACRLVAVRAVHVTIVLRADALERARDEVRSELGVTDASARSYIRLIALPSKRDDFLADPLFDAAFLELYDKLAVSQAFSCPTTGEEHDPLPPPRAAVGVPLHCTAELMKSVRARSQVPLKFFIWYPHAPSVLFLLHGPANRGCVKDLRSKLELTASKLAPEDTIEETIRYLSSVLIRIPGYEPMYSYEVQPQESFHISAASARWTITFDAIAECDGLISPTPECYDRMSIIGNTAWMAETSRGAYHIGPIVSRGAQAVEVELAQADGCAKIRDFVSAVLKSHGPNSLLYISFGTQQWPKDPEKLWAFLDVVLELSIPFILSHYAASVPDDIRARIERSGLGLLSTWCPQQMILNHPVTGWFVTNCGHSGVVESIEAGVPMICWPFLSYEAFNAIHMSETLNIAYELIQIRTGHGLKRIYRTGVTPVGTPQAITDEARKILEMAFGADGAKKRAKIQRVREQFKAAWSEQGDSRRATEQLLADIEV